MMNWLDRQITKLAPQWGLRRAQARHMLGAYEATKPGRNRKMRGEHRGPDTVQSESGESMRAQARHYDENYDLVTGALDTLVMRVVGPKGIMVEPMVRRADGTLHDEFNRQINDLRNEWAKSPDVTGEYSNALCEQLSCRTWLRDGEVFAQLVSGTKPGLPMPAGVPFAVELLEPDFVPYHYFASGAGSPDVVQGIEKNAWRRPIAYWIYRGHPGDYVQVLPKQSDLKRVSADNIQHLKFIKRIGQTRGVSILHAVITRIEDLKDYEESERVAARIAAAAAFYIKKGNPDSYLPPQEGDETDRTFKVAPGLIFDRLQPGEEVGSIHSNRPSALLEPFRNAMVRMFAAGTRLSYSSASKNYDGTYSAQRQELVEQFDHYGTLQGTFISKFTRPIYEQMLRMAVMSGRLVVPDDVDQSTLFRAHYQGPAMPWIDPDKESKANERNNRAGYQTRSAIIRSRNENPLEVEEQLQRERQREGELGLVLTSNAVHELIPQQPEPQQTEPQDGAE